MKLITVIAFVALSVSACATNRSNIVVKAPVGEQPKSGTFAKITEVRDTRRFSVDPGDPTLPSLGNPDEIRDPTITGRAVARKRNGQGTAMGDITLPANTSVAALVRASAKKALQDKGYVVVDESSPEFARALPLAIDVVQFWAWSFSMLRFEFSVTLALKGDSLLASDPSYVNSRTVVHSITGMERVWAQTVQTGVYEMTEKMKPHIKPSPNTPLVSQNNGLAAPIGLPGS